MRDGGFSYFRNVGAGKMLYTVSNIFFIINTALPVYKRPAGLNRK
jgi:hypothetical protein